MRQTGSFIPVLTDWSIDWLIQVPTQLTMSNQNSPWKKTNDCISVSDSGSGAFLTPGSGIRNRFFPDPGSRIPNPYFWELSDNFLGKKFYNTLKTSPNFFQHFKNKIVQFCEIYGLKKKSYDNKFFFTPVFHCYFWIRDPRSGMGKKQDPG